MLEKQTGCSTDPGFWSGAVHNFLLPLVLEAGSYFFQDSLRIQPYISCHPGSFLVYQAGISTWGLLWAKFLPSPFLLFLAATEPSLLFFWLSLLWNKHVITYQKISVLDRKKIEARYNQDFFCFSVVTISIQSCLAHFSQPFSRLH